MQPPMNRRKFGRAIRAAVALTVATGVAGCATIQSAVNSLGGAAGTAAVEQVIADIQGELTAGQLVLAAGAQWLSATAVSTVNKAIEGAQAAAAALGAAVANAATGTTVQTIEGFISDIVQALVAGLSGGAPVWLTAAVGAMQALLPAITAFVNSFLGTTAVPTLAATVSFMQTIPAARARLGIVTVG